MKHKSHNERQIYHVGSAQPIAQPKTVAQPKTNCITKDKLLKEKGHKNTSLEIEDRSYPGTNHCQRQITV